jgi:hypothetical protein
LSLFREIDDLNQARLFVEDLASLHEVIMERSVQEGVNTAIKIIKNKFTSKDILEKLAREHSYPSNILWYIRATSNMNLCL